MDTQTNEIYRKRSRGKRDRRWTDRQTETKEREEEWQGDRDKETETQKYRYTERQKIDRLTGR